MTEELTKQNMEFFAAVAKQSQDNFDRINKRLEERDEKLMSTIRLIQEQKVLMLSDKRILNKRRLFL